MDKGTEEQLNNPLHGLKLKDLLQELVDHYGWDILADQININSFKSYPSMESSLKFLRKTEWAREKLEIFYLYKYKRLPKPDDQQYLIPPRQRTIYLDQKPRPPAVIEISDKSVEEEEEEKEKRTTTNTTSTKSTESKDPWAKWKE
jgi:uncharacterized protein (DUF2132 family)